MKILEEYLIDFPNIAELILIVLSIYPRTSLLKRSYSKLTKTLYKNGACVSAETHDILYLLCTLRIIDDNELFSKVREQVRMSLDDLSKFGIWYIQCFNIFRVATFCLFV